MTAAKLRAIATRPDLLACSPVTFRLPDGTVLVPSAVAVPAVPRREDDGPAGVPELVLTLTPAPAPEVPAGE